jgi:hypothetical protein
LGRGRIVWGGKRWVAVGGLRLVIVSCCIGREVVFVIDRRVGRIGSGFAVVVVGWRSCLRVEMSYNQSIRTWRRDKDGFHGRLYLTGPYAHRAAGIHLLHADRI